MNLGTWISIPRAAAIMEMTRQGARKRLKILNVEADGRLLRRISSTGRGGRLEVSLDVLQELMVRKRAKPDLEEQVDREILQTTAKVQDLELKVESLRDAHVRLRKQVMSLLGNSGKR